MADTEHIRIFEDGTEAWNEWRLTNEFLQPDLSHYIFMYGRILSAEHQESLEPTEEIISDSTAVPITGYNFKNCNFSGCRFEYCRVMKCNFQGADLSNCSFNNSSFFDTLFSLNAYEVRKLLESHEADELSDHPYVSKFDNSQAYDASFECCALSLCDLTTVKLDESFQLSRCGVVATKMTKHQLETLDNYGGLSRRRLGEMTVIDDLALLRGQFSGFLNAIHVVALIVFLSPYIWFVIHQWHLAKVGDLSLIEHKNTSPILINLFRFILSGGDNWREIEVNLPVFAVFVIGFSLNLLRLALLLKTKSIEHRQEVNGFHRDVKIGTNWKHAFNAYKFISVLGLLLMITHTVLFLLKPVPLI